jgi:hypothetical protein
MKAKRYQLRAMNSKVACAFKVLDEEEAQFDCIDNATELMRKTVLLAKEMYPNRFLSIAVWNVKDERYEAIFSTESDYPRYFNKR